MALLVLIAIGVFVLAIGMSLVSRVVDDRSIFLKALIKTFFVWLASVIFGAIFFYVFICITDPPQEMGDITDTPLMIMIFGFLFSCPVLVPLFFLHYLAVPRIAQYWQRVAFLLAVSYIMSYLVIALVFNVPLFTDLMEGDVLVILVSYMAANTLAVLFSEKRWP